MQMQYSTYRTLLAPIAEQGISEAEAKDILRQILTHLCGLHDLKQTHGAISLDTVAYDYSRMEIILLAANGTNDPIYLAPEILQTKQATPSSDIYALGVLIIALLTGFPPEALKAPNGAWNWQEHCSVSDQFMQILNIALFAEPAVRYINAGQMLRAVQPVIKFSESTITNNHGILLLPPSNSKDSVSKQFSPSLLLSETHSLELLNSAPNGSNKAKKLNVNFQNLPIYSKAKAYINPSKESTKGKVRILAVILLAFGTTMSGAIGSYFYMQPKSADTAKKNLEFANVVNQSMDKAIARIDEEKKADANTRKLITLAKDKYAKVGSSNEAKTILQSIPFGSRMRTKAEQFLTRAEENIKKNNDLNQKTEKSTKDEKWQIAIDAFKGVSIAPYLQRRDKEVIEDVKQKLDNPTVATAPQSAPSNADLPRNPTIETYTPSPEVYTPATEATYNPPVAAYNPPQDKSVQPLPPAPRVAN